VRRAAFLVAAWSLPGLLSALQFWLLSIDDPDPFWHYLIQVPPWWVWAAATPLVGRLAERRPLVGGGWRRNLPWHVGAFVAIDVAHACAFGVMTRLTGTGVGELPLLLAIRVLMVKLSFVVALAYAAVIAIHYAMRLRRVRAELEVQLARAQLDALRMQIRPHFLFNALNTIAMQVRTGQHAGAVDMLSGLGALLRAAVDESAPEVTLERELALVRRHLEIEQVRFGDRLRVGWDIADDCARARVPAFLLQPLVENALRHGIGASPAGGELRVHARRDGGRLLIEVLDDGAGLAGPVQPRVGLGNVRARLERLYPAAHALDVAARAGGGVRTSVSIPFAELADD
jgi:sensor histidine kinase YesM